MMRTSQLAPVSLEAVRSRPRSILFTATDNSETYGRGEARDVEGAVAGGSGKTRDSDRVACNRVVQKTSMYAGSQAPSERTK